MLALLGLVTSIGLADSITPSTLAASLLLASGPRPRRSVLEFTAGVFVVFLLGGVVLTAGPGEAILALVPRPSATTRHILDLIAGVAMLATAVALWLARGRLGRREHTPERPRRGRSPFLLGATIAALELPTAFPYFAVVAAIVGSGLALDRQLLLVLVYNLCLVLPLLGIVATLAIAGDGAVRVLARARQYLQKHWPVLLAVLALVAGAFVTTLGVTGLVA